MDVIGERMASQTKASKIEKLTALPGVGAATAKKLVDAKLDTVSKVASAGASKLIKAGIKAAVAKKIASAAKSADKAASATKAVADIFAEVPFGPVVIWLGTVKLVPSK